MTAYLNALEEQIKNLESALECFYEIGDCEEINAYTQQINTLKAVRKYFMEVK